MSSEELAAVVAALTQRVILSEVEARQSNWKDAARLEAVNAGDVP